MIVELADKLIDRLIQLLTYRKQMRTELLDKYLTPVFNEFENLHAAYLDSFIRYRELIQTANEPNWIPVLQATLEKDNLFSANCRSKVLRLAEAEHDEILGEFVKGISDYLLDARLVDCLGERAYPHMTQRWRKSMVRTLGWIAEERWQLVIDPIGAAAPLNPHEIEEHLEQRRSKYAIGVGTRAKDDELKRCCALWALDAIVQGMQAQYDRVCSTYAGLRCSLAK